MKKKLRGAARSWTIWFNGVSASVFAAVPVLQDSLPQLQQYISPQMYKWVGLFVVIGNIVLRFRTTTSLDEKGSKNAGPAA